MTVASRFAGIGRAILPLYAPKPPSLDGRKPTPSAPRAASLAKPKSGRLADRVSVIHARPLTESHGCRRDAIVVTFGTSRFASELHQSPQVGTWATIPFGEQEPGISRNALADAVLEATRRDLPDLFVTEKPNRATRRQRKFANAD
jgi:hypothetical protein